MIKTLERYQKCSYSAQEASRPVNETQVALYFLVMPLRMRHFLFWKVSLSTEINYPEFITKGKKYGFKLILLLLQLLCSMHGTQHDSVPLTFSPVQCSCHALNLGSIRTNYLFLLAPLFKDVMTKSYGCHICKQTCYHEYLRLKAKVEVLQRSQR